MLDRLLVCAQCCYCVGNEEVCKQEKARMKKLSILFTLVLFTLTMGVDAAEQGGKMVAGDEFQYNDQTLDDKLGYLYKISLEQPQAVFEMAKVGASVDYISKALQHYTFDRSYTIALRYFRAQGLHQINLQRHENDQPINIAEIELALADFDDVLKKIKESDLNVKVVEVFKRDGSVGWSALIGQEIAGGIYINKILSKNDDHFLLIFTWNKVYYRLIALRK